MIASRLLLMWCIVACINVWTAAHLYGQNAASDASSESKLSRVRLGPALPRSTNVWNPTTAVTLVGTVQKLDQQSIEITLRDGNTTKQASERIEHIDVAWHTAEAAACHERFAQGKFLDALKQNDKVLSAGGFPKWQQCVLLAELVECAEAINKPDIAGMLFLTLTEQSPPEFLLATIPLNWTTRQPNSTVEKAATEWLEQPSEYAGLLGASWLLLTSKGDVAKQRLQKLQTSPSKLIQRWAAIQLWRATPPSETTGNLQKWYTARDSLSLPMQLGPSEFLADRLARIDKSALALESGRALRRSTLNIRIEPDRLWKTWLRALPFNPIHN